MGEELGMLDPGAELARPPFLRRCLEGVERLAVGEVADGVHGDWEPGSGGPADDVVVVANFLNQPQDGYVIGFPAAGTWKLRFNSDWQGYSENFEGYRSTDAATEPGEYDGFPFRAALSIGPYSVLIFSQ